MIFIVAFIVIYLNIIINIIVGFFLGGGGIKHFWPRMNHFDL